MSQRAGAFLATLVVAAVLLPVAQADDFVADSVVVRKSERKLYLLKDEQVIGAYDIALGLVPEGHKLKEGDFRTPEGHYQLTNRLIDSDFFMAIQISYPGPDDAARAASMGVAPGGQIMIHGQPGQPRKSSAYYKTYDWTDGCIAVSNSAMVDIWQMTKPNTPITIEP